MRIGSRLVRGPVRPDRGSLLRFVSISWAALPVIDRRWTAPMSALALAFGLFIGVAIGPGTQGSLGTTRPMVIRLPPPTETVTEPAHDAHGSGAESGHGANRGSPPAPPASVAPPPANTGPASAPPPLPPSIGPSVTPPSLIPPPPTTAPTTTPPQPPTTTTATQPPPAEPATALTGTVVHANPKAASYTLAVDGRLTAIHSHDPPPVGEVIEVETRSLVNGTLAEDGRPERKGSRGRVEFSGTVSFRDPRSGLYSVSAPGVSVLVRGGSQRRPPEVGDPVDVEARIADHPEPLEPTPPGRDGCGDPPLAPAPPQTTLEQVGLDVTGDRVTTTDVEAIVEGVCRDDHSLVVSADDLRESGQGLAVSVPETIRIAELEPGQALKLSVTIGGGGSLDLTSLSADSNEREADDPDLAQP